MICKICGGCPPDVGCVCPPKPDQFAKDLAASFFAEKDLELGESWNKPKPEVSAVREWWVAKARPTAFTKTAKGCWTTTIANRKDELRLSNNEHAISSTHVIEKSAYDAVVKELAFTREAVEQERADRAGDLEQFNADLEAVEIACETLKRERDELAGLDRWNNSAAINKIKEERDALKAQLAEANKKLEQWPIKWQAQVDASCSFSGKLESLERALEYAKSVVAGGPGVFNEIERLTKGSDE